MADRTVHCTIVPPTGPRIELVRYEAAGKWFYESGPTRRPITLDEAVAMCTDRPAVIWHEGRPGGRVFDARVRAMREGRTRELKCPSCGELMGTGTPYVTWGPYDPDVPEHYEISSDRPAPSWILDRAPSGHKFECKACGCKIDVPVRELVDRPEEGQ